MPTPKQKDRSDRMFHAALEEFASHGFHQANVDLIALKAGVSKATIYSHFETKEALFLAVFERVLKQVFTPPSAFAKSMPLKAGFRMRLKDFLSKIAGSAETRFFFQCMTSGSELIREDLRHELTARFTAVLLGEIKEIHGAQHEGLIRPHLDFQIVQQAIVGILLQTIRFWLEQGQTMSIKHLSDQLVSIFLFGLAVPEKVGAERTGKTFKSQKPIKKKSD